MEPEDIDELLENGRYKHLSEETLVAYRDNQLDKIRVALADAHLKLCLICERKLAFLREEAEAVANYVITDEDRAAVQETVRRLKEENKAPASWKIKIERLRANINSFLDKWMLVFAPEPVLGNEDGDAFRYESEDDSLTVWARLKEDDASLEVYFSSPDLALEGARLRFRLGPFQTEVTLEHEEESKVVVATIRIPRRERPKKMTDIEIEII